MPSPLSPYAVLPPEPLESYAQAVEFQGGSLLERDSLPSPETVIAELARSGLSGRGGAGFPTGTKWASLHSHPSRQKCVVLNAAEGEPGSFKDRWILRQNPYPVLEALVLAAKTLGTDLVYLGIKKAYRKSIERLAEAIEELDELDLLHGVEFELVEGPDEYLFGEETALLQVIEGQGPFPREPHYPPYEWGIEASAAFPNPALVQNVETMARIPSILIHGPEGFRALGQGRTFGPLALTLSGAIQAPGIYEVAAGTPLREVLETLGQGPRPGSKWVAVLPGISHPAIPEAALDVPLDHESLKDIGSGLGSAGFLVLDQTMDLRQLARAIARFLAIESCGQCHACERGLTEAHQGLEALGSEPATSDALRRIVEEARSAPNGNRCNLPFQGSQILPSLIEDFPQSFFDPSAKRSPRVVLPKFLDFDPVRRRFTVDRAHLRKQMDWSYLPFRPRGAPRPEDEKLSLDSGSEESSIFADEAEDSFEV